jgi:hypothetical protein
MVMFMRMVTSAQIQTHSVEYEPFVIHPDLGEKMGVKEFCQNVVEILGREAGEWRGPLSSLVCTRRPKDEAGVTQITYK